MNTQKEKKKVSLTVWILAALILGIAAGLLLQKNSDIAETYIKPLGTIFLNLVKMVVVPVVLFSIMQGVISLQDIRKVGSIGGKTVLFYMCTTAFAVTLGLVIANVLNVGSGYTLSSESLEAFEGVSETPSFIDTIVNIFPSNAIQPLAEATMLQIIVIYLGPGLLGMNNPWPSGSGGRMVAAVVAFAINYACYFSEIYRGGIEAVPKGQTEAGQVLGMTKTQIFFKVTLLQVVKRILPPMGNEIITLVKDTSLANTIANKEIIMMAKEYSAKGLIWPLFSTALFFLVFVGALTILFDWAEKKLDYFRC